MRKIEMENAMMEKSKVSVIKYQDSQFAKKIKEEEEQKRIEQEKKNRFRQDYNYKIKEFRSYVRENFSPQTNDKSKFIPKKMTTPAQHMSMAERV